MDNKITAQLTELSKKMMDSVATMQKINERIVQDLAKQQLESVSNFVKSGFEQLKSMGAIKTPQESVTNQAEMASKVGEMILSNAKQNMEVLTRGQSELTNLINNNIKELLEKPNAVAREK